MDERAPWELRDAETSGREMKSILATDMGIDPDTIKGFVIVLAVDHPDAPPGEGVMMPVTRSSMPRLMTAYLLSIATQAMLQQEIETNGECDCDPSAPTAFCGHAAPHAPHDSIDGPCDGTVNE